MVWDLKSKWERIHGSSYRLQLSVSAVHSVERLQWNSPTDIELILVLREPFWLVKAGKKIFFNLINYELEKNSSKVGKNGHLCSDLAMFQFPVMRPIVADMGIVLGLLGTYKNIPKRKKCGRSWFNFTT